MAAPNSPATFTGHCYCDTVSFSIKLYAPAIFAGFCHCEDCQRAHASPMYQFAYIDASAFTLESGEAYIGEFVRDSNLSPNLKRCFCTVCGSRVFNRLAPEFEGRIQPHIGVFPATLNERDASSHPFLKPRYHLHSNDATFALGCLQDRLPRR
ncbi:MAG: GFA family protein [Pseudomonadota bacterium]